MMVKKMFLVFILLFALVMPFSMAGAGNVTLYNSSEPFNNFTAWQNSGCALSGNIGCSGANQETVYNALPNLSTNGAEFYIEFETNITAQGPTHFYGDWCTDDNIPSCTRILGLTGQGDSTGLDAAGSDAAALSVAPDNLHYKIRIIFRNNNSWDILRNDSYQGNQAKRAAEQRNSTVWMFRSSSSSTFSVANFVVVNLSGVIPPPAFFTAFAINNSAPLKNEFVNISVNVTATDTNVSGYIFQWDNGTGLFINDSFVDISANKWSLANVSVIKQIEATEGTVINYRWFFNTTDGANQTSINQSVLVENVSMDACGLHTVIAANFSFFDEDTNLPVKADADATFDWEFLSIKSETLNVDKTNVNDFQVCITPGRASFSVDYSISYQNSTYPLRRFFSDGDTFNNQTQIIKLYVLDENEGIFIRFVVIDVQGTNIVGATITAKTAIANVQTTTEIEKTDSAGLATFWVDPDKDYIFTFVKSGFQTVSFTLRPTTSELQTVTMGTTEGVQEISLATGINYQFRPRNDVLQNQTSTNFTFNLTSKSFNITSCSITVTNGTATLANSTGNFNTSVCGAQVTVNTANHTSIFSIGSYTLNGTTPFNVTQLYNVKFTFVGSISLKVLIDDINAFAGSGFDNFSRAVLGLLFTFLFVGLAAKGSTFIGSRVADEVNLILLALASIWFFSYSNWFNIPLTTFPDLPVLGLSREFLQQWFAFFLSALGGTALIIGKRK